MSGNDAGGHVGLLRRGDEHPGAAVVQHVGRLLDGQAGADGGVVEPGVVGAPGDRVEVGLVLDAEGEVVARHQAGGPDQLRQPVGLGMQLGVADLDARGRP